MSKKIEDLIKTLKEAKEILNKDDIDEKIKAKMMAEMKRRNFTEADATRHVIDRDRGDKLPKPVKQPKPLLQSEDATQAMKTEAARALKKPKEEEVKKSAAQLADSVIDRLQKATGVAPIKVNIPPKKTAAEAAEEKVMGMLAKTVGAMMPQNNRRLQPTQEEFEAEMVRQGIAFTPEQLEKMDENWGNTMTDFFREATKPISQRFSSEEEEEAYWASIRVSDKGDNGPGY